MPPEVESIIKEILCRSWKEELNRLRGSLGMSGAEVRAQSCLLESSPPVIPLYYTSVSLTYSALQPAFPLYFILCFSRGSSSLSVPCRARENNVNAMNGMSTRRCIVLDPTERALVRLCVIIIITSAQRFLISRKRARVDRSSRTLLFSAQT